MNSKEALALGKLALTLGRVNRATFHEDGVRPETDTDHTVMLGLIAVQFAAELDLDTGRVALFALVHDLVEAYAGDTFSVGMTPEQARDKHTREKAALERLRAEVGGELVLLIDAYEDQYEPAARFVRYLDKVMPKITHILNGCTTFVGRYADVKELVKVHKDQIRALRRDYPEFPEVHRLLEVMCLQTEFLWRK